MNAFFAVLLMTALAASIIVAAHVQESAGRPMKRRGAGQLPYHRHNTYRVNNTYQVRAHLIWIDLKEDI